MAGGRANRLSLRPLIYGSKWLHLGFSVFKERTIGISGGRAPGL